MKRSSIATAIFATALSTSLTSPAAAQDTLADMEPMKLRVATLFGPDNLFTDALEDFTARIEERTGGKLTFDYYYAGALVPGSELISALGDGVFDIGYVNAAVDAARFPVDQWQSTLAIPTEPNPILAAATSAMASYEWTSEFDEHRQQLLDNGIFPLIPALEINGPYGLLCKDANSAIDSVQGKRVRVGGETWTGEAQNLGMTPVSLVITEIYQALQAGIIDCVMIGAGDVGDLGFFDHAKYFNTGAGLTGYAQGSYGVNLERWNSLPQEVKDIIWEETPKYATDMLRNTLMRGLASSKKGVELGVEFTAPDEAMRKKIDDYHEKVRADAVAKAPPVIKEPAGQVAKYSELKAKWHKILTEDLSFDGQYSSWQEIVEAGAELPDFDPLTERVRSEIVEELRAKN